MSIGEAFEAPVKQMDIPPGHEGKLDKISVGVHVLYATDRAAKKCRVGLVLAVARTENCLFVHRLEPQTDQRLRVRWRKVYLDAEGRETIEPTAQPSKAQLEASQVLETITISRDGGMNAKAIRRFDSQNWTLDRSTVEGADTEVPRPTASVWAQFNAFVQEFTAPPRGLEFTAVAPKQPHPVEGASHELPRGRLRGLYGVVAAWCVVFAAAELRDRSVEVRSSGRSYVPGLPCRWSGSDGLASLGVDGRLWLQA